jgi:hypothetical protein
MKEFAVACVVVALAGCASHRHVVSCNGRLEPINLPAPASTGPTAGASAINNAEAETRRE